MLCSRIWTLIACSLLTSKGAIYKESSITYEEIGVLLQEDGVTAIDTTHSVISTFVKIELPPVCGETADYNKDVDDVISKQIDMFHSLTGLEAPARQKRQLLAILGTSLLSAAFGTIGSLFIHKRASNNKNQFLQFAQDQNSFNKKIVQFEKDVVKVLKETEKQYAAIKCESRREIVAIQYISKIQSMFSMLKNGVLCSELTTDILELKDIELILEQHPELNSTLYSTDSVAFFYRVAEICIADISYKKEASLTLHYLITTPWLTHSNTFPSFKIAQTGFAREGSCYNAKLPRNVIKANNEYKSIDNLMCKGEKLPICAAEPAKHMMSINCLTNITACSLEKVPCKDNFVYDKAGILIKHSKEVHLLDNHRTIKVVPAPKNEVTFVPWDQVSIVQIGNRSIYSPTFVSSYIRFTTVNINYTDAAQIVIPEAPEAPLSHHTVITSPSIWLVAGSVCLITVALVTLVCGVRKIKIWHRHSLGQLSRIRDERPSTEQNNTGSHEGMPQEPEQTTLIIPS